MCGRREFEEENENGVRQEVQGQVLMVEGSGSPFSPEVILEGTVILRRTLEIVRVRREY